MGKTSTKCGLWKLREDQNENSRDEFEIRSGNKAIKCSRKELYEVSRKFLLRDMKRRHTRHFIRRRKEKKIRIRRTGKYRKRKEILIKNSD